MHPRPFKFRYLSELSTQFDTVVQETLKEHHAAGTVKMPADPVNRPDLASYYGDFYKLPQNIQSELELIYQTFATLQVSRIKRKYKPELATAAMLLVAGRTPALKARLEQAAGVSRENVMHEEELKRKFEFLRYFRQVNNVCLSSFQPLSFGRLADNFYNDVLDNEYEKYKVVNGSDISYNIPPERRAQLRLIENTIDQLKVSKMADADKAMILTGAMVMVEKMIYDSYWVKANVTNSEVYKHIIHAYGAAADNKLDAATEKAVLLAFRNYMLVPGQDKNPIFDDVDSRYLTSRYVSSYIAGKLNPKVGEYDLKSVKLADIDYVQPKRTKVEDIAMHIEPEKDAGVAVIKKLHHHYNPGLFRDINSYDKRGMKKAPVQAKKVEEKSEASLKLK